MNNENFNAGVAHISRVPFGRTYRYYIKFHGFTIRISGDLYKQIRSTIGEKK